MGQFSVKISDPEGQFSVELNTQNDVRRARGERTLTAPSKRSYRRDEKINFE